MLTHKQSLASRYILSNLLGILSKFTGEIMLLRGDFNLPSDLVIALSNSPLPSDASISVAFDEFEKMLSLIVIHQSATILKPLTVFSVFPATLQISKERNVQENTLLKK